MGALTNRVVLVSQQPGFRFWVFLISVLVGYVLGDDHSLMGGSDDAWYGGLLDCLTTTFILYVLCACPLDVGIILCVFAPCFAYPM